MDFRLVCSMGHFTHVHAGTVEYVDGEIIVRCAVCHGEMTFPNVKMYAERSDSSTISK